MPASKGSPALKGLKDAQALQVFRDLGPPPDLPTPPEIDENGKMLSPGNAPMPSIFRSEPIVVGKELGQAVNQLLTAAPNYRGHIKSVVPGPTYGSIRNMVSSGMQPDEFMDTTLAGVASSGAGHEGEIGINPGLVFYPPVLAHEVSHLAGNYEDNAEIAEEAYRRAFDYPKIPGDSDFLARLRTAPLETLRRLISK